VTVQSGEEFYAQLIPIEGDRVLLPAAAVREAIQMDRIELNTGSPAWLLGHVNMGGERMPVVSLEGMLGRSMPSRSARSRLVRILSLGDGGSWLLVAQGQPHMTPLNTKALAASPLEAHDPLELVLSRGRIANLSVFIPDLETIEERLQKAQLGNQSADLPDWQPSQ